METIVHKQKKTGDGSISFPGLHCWNPVISILFSFIKDFAVSKSDTVNAICV